MIVAKATPSAPRVSTAWLVRLRGLLAVPIAGALVLAAPGLASAAFTARTTAAVSVATYKIPAPSIQGTLHCTSNEQRSATITITEIGDVDRATGYTATLIPPRGSESVVSVPTTGMFQITMQSANGGGRYTFTVAARVGSWTGESLVQTVNC